jgi:hypothetical protein
MVVPSRVKTSYYSTVVLTKLKLRDESGDSASDEDFVRIIPVTTAVVGRELLPTRKTSACVELSHTRLNLGR